MTETNSEHDLARLTKLNELAGAGIEPYPPRLNRPRTHTAAEAIAAFEQAETEADAAPVLVNLAGRMLSRRIMGKVGFAHVEDGSGRVQIFVRKDVVGDEPYDLLFKRLLDLGDFIAVSGRMVRTKTGEVSCEAQQIQLLARVWSRCPTSGTVSRMWKRATVAVMSI